MFCCEILSVVGQRFFKFDECGASAQVGRRQPRGVGGAGDAGRLRPAGVAGPTAQPAVAPAPAQSRPAAESRHAVSIYFTHLSILFYFVVHGGECN